jgi:hypothetical protein
LLRKLQHENSNVYDMLDRYGSADVYPVYSHLSGMSHTSIETVSAYLEWIDDGAPQLRQNAAEPGYAGVIQLAIALVQAAHAISPLMIGDPMRADIDQAVRDLGLQGVTLFRGRMR